MNKYFLTAIIIAAFLSLSSHQMKIDAYEFFSPLNFTAETKKAIETIFQLPEAKELYVNVQKQGPIKIEMFPMENEESEAFWDGNDRAIRINSLKNSSEGVLISSILFELHNALTNYQLIYLVDLAVTGQISQEVYVENVERMEHQNALRTSELIDIGIKKGLFPSDAYWPIFKNFEDHYQIQQIQGHSAWLANHYNQICPYGKQNIYRGTLTGVEAMSQIDKEDMMRYIALKVDLESAQTEFLERGVIGLYEECGHLQGCVLGTSSANCERTQQRIYLLQKALRGNNFFDKLKMKSTIAEE